jgi:dCTP deaminase
MIPSDELVEALADPGSGFSITPLIDAAGQIGEGSIDIRLGPDIIVSPRATGATAFDATDPAAFRQNLDQRQQYIRRGIGDPFQLQPGEFVIGRSLEYIALPDDISAEALGRSSWGRLGLVIATATLIQPGFKGTITLELANVGDTPIVLTVGLSIAQLVFSRSERPAAADRVRHRRTLRRRGNGARRRQSRLAPAERDRLEEWRRRHRRQNETEGRYKLQIKPALSRLHKDEDLRWVTPLAVRYVLGVVGMQYSGKSTTVDFLTTRRHFRLYRLTQFIAEEARRRGLDASNRAIRRRVGNEMRAELGDEGLARLAFSRIRSEMLDPDRSRELEPIVVEGFRLPAELEVWQEIELFRPVVVGAGVGVRRRRAIEGGWLDDDWLDQRGYPRDGSDGEKDLWFVANVDQRRGSHPASAVVRAAAEHPNAIFVDNDFARVPDLHDSLKEQLAELEKWWRAREY